MGRPRVHKRVLRRGTHTYILSPLFFKSSQIYSEKTDYTERKKVKEEKNMTPQKETRRRNAVITENTLSVKQTTIQASTRTGRRNAQTGMIILSLYSVNL